MEYSEDDLVPLKKALVSGVTSVTVNGRTVTFASIEALTKLINNIEASIKAKDEPATPLVNPNRITATFKK